MKLNTLIEDLISRSPTGELSEVRGSLSQITPSAGSVLILEAVSKHIEREGHAITNTVIFHETKTAESGKFIDYQTNEAYNLSGLNLELIDRENVPSDWTRPSYFEDLAKALNVYGARHYPNSFKFNIYPYDDKLKIIIISEKADASNFFSGKWRSIYTVDNSNIYGDVDIDIHYYEDGNVRFRLSEEVDGLLKQVSGQEIVSFIERTENQLVLQTVKLFEDLNQNHFKHLRRLLPVTKSKINWGKAIGNYRLGSNVANRR